MQQAWFSANNERFCSKIGIKESPFFPPYIFFMKDGVEEVWVNKEAKKFIIDNIKKRVVADKEFFLDIHKSYFKRLSELKKNWDDEINTLNELKIFIDKVYDGISDFVILYEALKIASLKKKYKKLAEQFRKEDTFFNDCNEKIIKALDNVYLGLDYTKIYITREELGKTIDRKDLKKRDNGFVLIPGVFKGCISFDEFVYKNPEFKFNIEQVEESTNFIKGQSAYKGIVRGNVRIVKRADQLNKINEGDILVSPMTTPDFVPAMKIALGFVTDEGGITCHAAIIAREMKKPCIIGTKNATQILQDGDLVEVDADRGIVKILEKNNSVIENDKVLTNIFSREKNLIYFCMWDDSDRKGMQMIGENIKNNLFIVPPIGQKGSVWYEKKELDVLKNIVIVKHKYFKNNFAWNSIAKLAEESWQFIKPYAKDERKIKGDKEFKLYYSNLVNFWVCLNSIFYEVADNSLIDKKIRDYLINFRNKTEKYTEKMSVLLSDYLSCHPKLKKLKTVLHFLTIKEVIDILEDKIKIKDLNEIKKRAEGCFMLNGVVYPSEKIKEVLKINNLTFERNDLDVNVIKGDVAFGGLAKGKVVIIDGFKDLDKIQDGDILVTQMTNPKYLPALKKSLAIVTDQGGTLCHAAISAREFKKPCIIGTNNATQVLQDGDFVELDANEGLIKILSRASKDILKKDLNNIPKIYQEFEKKLEGHEKFTFYGPHSPLVIGGVAWGNEKYFKKYFSKLKVIPAYLHLVNGRIVISIIDNDAYRNCAVQKFKDFIDGKVTLTQLKKDYKKVNKQVNELYSKKIINPEDTIKKAYNLILHLFAVTLYAEIFTKEIVEDILKIKIKNSVWEKVANPPFDHFERRWDQLIKKTKNPLKIDFVFMNYYFLPSTKNIYKKWEEEKNKPAVKKTKGYIMNKEKWMKYTQFVIELRDIRKDAIAKIGSLLCKSARMIYPELTDDILAHLNPLEIIENKKPSKKELERRLRPYVLSVDSDLGYKYDYNSYNKIKSIIDYAEKRPDFIKGFSAKKGNYKGIVKIIFDPIKADFEKGNILVTSMTRPEFVPLMKKAGAIITNEGGVTCHAAIISRELGIPCIIGTKNATQILKDGDLVEVDADNGVVRILNK